MTLENALEVSEKSSDIVKIEPASVVKLRPGNGVTAPKLQGRGRPWAKGQSGNSKGRPKGALSRRTIGATLASILTRQGKAVLKQCITAALAGDVSAMRLIIDRCLPRERLVKIELPKIRCAGDAREALTAIMDHAGAGTISPAEASSLSALARSYIELSELHEIKQRLLDVEARLGSQ